MLDRLRTQEVTRTFERLGGIRREVDFHQAIVARDQLGVPVNCRGRRQERHRAPHPSFTLAEWPRITSGFDSRNCRTTRCWLSEVGFSRRRRCGPTRSRHKSGFGEFAISVFGAADETELEALAAGRLNRFELLTVTSAGAIRRAELAVLPTFRRPHYSILLPDLDADLRRLLRCQNEVRVTAHYESPEKAT